MNSIHAKLTSHTDFLKCELPSSIYARSLTQSPSSICEMQADSITRRYESMRVASLRLHWSVPNKSKANGIDSRAKDLWGYVQEDSAANAFMLAMEDSDKWMGHERFFIASPTTAVDEETLSLLEKYWPQVPIKEGKSLTETQGLFDCSKAAKLLGWHHTD